MDKRIAAWAGVGRGRRVRSAANIAGSAAVAGALCGLRARGWRELDLPPVHAGLRERVGRGGADPGDGADVSEAARSDVAAHRWDDHQRSIVYAGRSCGMVCMDQAGAANRVSCAVLLRAVVV